MKTNDIRKGVRFRLANGWYATMMDNRRGNIREAEVEGMNIDRGSIYTHDIVSAQFGEEGCWDDIKHTPAQIKLRATVKQELRSAGRRRLGIL